MWELILPHWARQTVREGNLRGGDAGVQRQLHEGLQAGLPVGLSVRKLPGMRARGPGQPAALQCAVKWPSRNLLLLGFIHRSLQRPARHELVVARLFQLCAQLACANLASHGGTAHSFVAHLVHSAPHVSSINDRACLIVKSVRIPAAATSGAANGLPVKLCPSHLCAAPL